MTTTKASGPDVASGPETTAWLSADVTLPRERAIQNLTDALIARDISEPAARALARAAVRPDEVRRRLAEPTALRVPGGVLEVVESLVWTPGVVPYPTNPREMGERLYPLGLADGGDGLLDEPTQTRGRDAELSLIVSKPKVLADRLRNAEQWLITDNPLANDITAEGILQPLTLVMLNIRHRDRSPAVTMLAAADGSSRTSAAHQILSLDVGRLAYQLSDRELRQIIGRMIRRQRDAGWDGLSEDEQARTLALTAPARIIVGYRGDPARGAPYDQAVRALIGLTHIRPPKAYGRAVERDAMADAVLDALARPLATRSPIISQEERAWFAGRLTTTQRDAAALPSAPDVRAAEIVLTVVGGGRRNVSRVNTGIRTLTAQQHVSPNTRVDIAVELILRTVRTEHAADATYSIATRRAAFQRAYRLPEIARLDGRPLQEGTDAAPLTLPRLRDAALEEIDDERDDDRLGPAQTELAIKAAYYMIVATPPALRRELVGRESDDEDLDERSLPVVLRAMLNTPRGVRQAYAVIKNGRAGRPLLEVDDDGEASRGQRGRPVVLDDTLIRSTYTGQPNVGAPTTGAAAAARAWTSILNAISELEEATERMSAVLDESGAPFVAHRGWPQPDVATARSRIDVVDRQVGGWGDRHANQSGN